MACVELCTAKVWNSIADCSLPRCRHGTILELCLHSLVVNGLIHLEAQEIQEIVHIHASIQSYDVYPIAQPP